MGFEKNGNRCCEASPAEHVFLTPNGCRVVAVIRKPGALRFLAAYDGGVLGAIAPLRTKVLKLRFEATRETGIHGRRAYRSIRIIWTS